MKIRIFEILFKTINLSKHFTKFFFKFYKKKYSSYLSKETRINGAGHVNLGFGIVTFRFLSSMGLNNPKSLGGPEKF